MQPDIARIIKVDDAKGREHECILKILIEHLPDANEGKHLAELFFLSPSLIQSLD
jgi:hypothetical protein